MNKKTVLITGSSRGIGKAIALAFSKLDYNIVINCKSSIEELNKLETYIKEYNKNVLSIVADVKNYDEVKAMFGLAKKKFSSVDIVINNASISHIGLFNKMEYEDYKNIIDNNLMSVINCSRVAVDDMLLNRQGNIINISSIWGNVGSSCEAVYSASKGAVNSFSKALGKELAPNNIRVNAIACGVIDTSMNDCLDDEEKESLIESIPMNRFGTTKEVADLCLFLASDSASYLTAQVITLDGGML